MNELLAALGISAIEALIYLGTALLLAIGFWLYYVRTYQRFEWTDWIYGFPLIGRLRRAVRERNLHANPQGLTAAEQTLMRDYHAHIPALHRAEFAEAYEFLLLAKQADRQSAPGWQYPALIFLLACEALAFSVLLVPVISNKITPLMAEVFSPILALLVAVVGAWITHAAGHETYTVGLINRMRREADDEKQSVWRLSVAPAGDQAIDQGMASPTRFGNRVLDSPSDQPRRRFLWGAIAYIIVIGGLSVSIRYYDFAGQETRNSAPAMSSAGNPYAAAPQFGSLPPTVSRSAQARARLVHDQERFDRFMSGVSGIFALGAIFIFTQLMSAGMGYMYGTLRAKRVLSALRITGGYASFDEFYRHELAPKIHRTNKRLTELRKGLFHDTQKVPSSMSFEEWLEGEEEKRFAAEDRQRARVGQVAAVPAVVKAPVPDVPAPDLAAPNLAAIAASLLDLPKPERPQRLLELKQSLSREQLDELRQAIDAEKQRRETGLESWMADV